MDKYSLYGVKFRRISKLQAVDMLCALIDKNKRTVVFTPNIQILGAASKDKRLVALLNGADMLLPDGIGVSLACRKNGLPPVERITGIDTAYAILAYASARGYKVFLLGGKPSIAKLAAKNLRRELPFLRICGTHHGYFDKRKNSPQNQAIIRKIRESEADILFVCFGFPAQETWISQNASLLPSVRLFMGLGGSIDVWSGKVKRAPKIVQKLNLEWLWRCVREPKRILPLIKNTIGLLH